MAQVGVPSLAWREIFAILGAVVIGGTAWTRLAVFAEPCQTDSDGADAPQPIVTAAAYER